MRAVSRVMGCSINTVMKLLVDAGTAAAEFDQQMVKGLNTKRLQCDEIWSFVGAKQKNVDFHKKKDRWGDAWTWICLDADSKLIVSHYVGFRDTTSAINVLSDARDRITTERVQITTDQLNVYMNTVHAAFLGEADYAQLHKEYGSEASGEKRYSPAQYIGSSKRVISGAPDPNHISTSYIERQNLTIRMSNRRFTRLTNAFSKKLENLAHSVALYAFHYNFCRIHKTLRVTPAIEAGITDHVWELADLLKWADLNLPK